ncbi:MAG: LD-carboxypeptidase [Actinomycetota bacterium]|nr:LD-carboxypeptidase [Actinomycetota bacterium]
MSEIAATRFGAPLPDGGTIGVPAPSGPWFNRSDILRGLEWWQERGYQVKLGDGLWDRDDYVAGDPKTRARDISQLFADPEVDVVQCLWGGTGTAQALPYIDFDAIAANPKAFIGFSDITALHVAIRQETGLATIHAPGFGGMGDPERAPWSKDRLLEFLKGDGTGEIPRDPVDPYVRAIRGGKVTAPLVGGNLWTLQHSMGTAWEFQTDGCILFFEEVDSPPYVIDGMLWQLRQAGKLDNVVGVVVGEMEKCDWREDRPEAPRTRSLEDVLEERLEPLGVPVLYKLPLGHGKHLAPMPLGVTATLVADERSLTFAEPALQPGS